MRPTVHACHTGHGGTRPVDEPRHEGAGSGNHGTVAHDLGTVERSSRAASGADPSGGRVLPARTVRTPGWRDPRLWVGVVLVAASVVLGARVLASADDTVGVWTLPADAGAGQRLSPEDLVLTRVRMPEGTGAYFTATDQLPASPVLNRAVSAGELLPRAALGGPGQDDRVQVSLAVDPTLVPPDTAPGSVVDLYLVDASRGHATDRAALSGASVVALRSPGETFSATPGEQLVLAVPEADLQSYLALRSRLQDPEVLVLLVG